MKKLQVTLEEALLTHIQAEVDQRAERVLSWEQKTGRCYCSADEYTCMCNTNTIIEVIFAVPKEINRFGHLSWRYDGSFFDFIQTLDYAAEQRAANVVYRFDL